MKWIGFFMVVAGFIIAALAVVINPPAITDANSVTVIDANAIEDANSVTVIDVNAIEDADSVTVTDTNTMEDANSATVVDESAVKPAREGAVKWAWYVPALAVGVLGVVIIRTTQARQTKTEHHVAANIEAIETSLARIATNIEKLNGEKDSINTYDMRHRIDELFIDDLEMFVDARESIAHRYGLTAYGQIMGSFAAGERYLNRVWSASADGYIDEVNEYLEKAKDQFAESYQKVRQLKADTPLPV